jgi:serine/threonine-protein kinase
MPGLVPNTVLMRKYRVEQVLGRGGMGVVVRARHLTLGEVVAIKLLNEELGLTGEMISRFMREAQAAARLRSQHVVRVTDVGRLDDGMPYMVMELLEGQDLAQLAAAQVIAPGYAANVVIQVCQALAEAHALGIVHRDIKPSNIFIVATASGKPFVKVLDFGIAKAHDPIDGAPITRTLSILGTPGYMSPEQLRSSRTVDGRTDVWALGVVLYEILEGRRPFTAESLPELCVQVAFEPHPAFARTPPALAAVVDRCLAKQVEDRFASVGEVAEALLPFADDRAQAQRDLEQMAQLVRASADRLDDMIETPVAGRFDGTVAAQPAPPSVEGTVSAQPVRPSGAITIPTPTPTPIAAAPRRRGSWVVASILLLFAGGAGAFVILRRESPATVPPPPVVEAPRADPPEPPRVEPPAVEAPVAPPVVPDPPIAKKRVIGKKRTSPKAAGSAAPVAPAGSATKPCDPFKDRLGC